MTKVTIGLQTCLALSPLFLLTISGWAGGTLFISSALALWVLLENNSSTFYPGQRQWLWYFSIMFILPILAVFISQFIRHDFIGRYYDSPARFLLALPIFVVLVKRHLDILRYMTYVIPGALLITFFAVTFKLNPWWNPTRVSTYFVDPLTFGSLNLTLGLFSLLSVDLYQHDLWRIKLYKILGFFIGIYLSILSGSRTGWLAAPLVILLWFNFRIIGYRIYLLALISILTIAAFYFSSTLQQRTGIAIDEIISYNWNEPNPDTSVGARFSFLRMAAFLFSQNPLAGFGDHGFADYINHPEFNRYALLETQKFALNAGFHNEIATNAVRSGIWGVLSSLSLFLMPTIFFIKQLKSVCVQTQKLALLAISYLLCIFISGMTTEVFNLKFTASFHALMFACLISALLVRLSSTQESA